MARTLSGNDAATSLTFEIGDKCEPLIHMSARAGQDFSTPVVGDVSLGTVMHVTEVGSGDRIKISTNKVSGWISCQTEMGMPLVQLVEGRPKRRSRLFTSEKAEGEVVGSESSFSIQQNPLNPSGGVYYARGELAPGDQGHSLVAMNVREGEAFSSEIIGRLHEGTQFEVACVGANDRIKIVSGDVVGWISTKADGERPLVQKKQEKKRNSFYKRLSVAKHEETVAGINGRASAVATATTLLGNQSAAVGCEEQKARTERPSLTLPIGKPRPGPPS
eukprot:CAMPEP_0171243196 /NCGR_PEP_ID=MMETSP0790-20130122/46157_1 /TAXON_ID=2925 /ORGANISM="Alexandrium catenella, Strain OF101" /LENGTH=275 /DNA_ID=CAMNT_0011710171 /DNA_START=29 /DNA_END=852 /DNA_ORIENTATION=-